MRTDRVGPAGRPPLRRPVSHRMLAGVCLGLAGHLGLHPTAVRAAFVVAAACGGLGVVVYAFVWAVTEEGEQLAPGTRRERPPVSEAAVVAALAGAALIVLGSALLLEQAGLDLRLDLLVPVLVVAVGAAFAWSQLDDAARRRWVPGEGRERQRTLTRLGAGVAIAVVGLLLLTTQGGGLGELWDVALPVVVVLAGVAVITAPYAMRLWRDLQAEQVARVRATERADIAAHLHDSVLQTLALIQRRSEDPQVTRLARAQERELRSWLYAGPRGPGSTLASAVADAAHEVEDLHGVPVDLVVTGDHALDVRGEAVVRALREAMVNAARHGSPPITAYVEVGPGVVEAFVRDHGAGFDPEEVPADRLGVRESILGRTRRHGGTATVRVLDHGTEVALSMPLPAPVAQPSPVAGRPVDPERPTPTQEAHDDHR